MVPVYCAPLTKCQYLLKMFCFYRIKIFIQDFGIKLIQIISKNIYNVTKKNQY